MRKTRIFIVLLLTIAVIMPSLIQVSAMVTNKIDDCISNEYERFNEEGFDLSRLDLPYDTSTELTPLAHTAVMMEDITLETDTPCSKNKGTCLTPDACSGYNYLGNNYPENKRNENGEPDENGIQTIYYSINSVERGSQSNREKFEERVRQAAEVWNSTRIYDNGSENGRQIINLVEADSSQTSIEGYPVCEIRYVTPNPNEITYVLDPEGEKYPRAVTGGFFRDKVDGNGDFSACHIEIYPEGNNVKTMMHELGHLLGLADLDDIETMPGSCHNTLMGYGPTASMQAADIQAAALFNLAHTEHNHAYFTYRPLTGEIMRHYCFYCGGYKDFENAQIGSKALVSSEYCDHIDDITKVSAYKPMVSSGETVWNKCTKCYGKTIENFGHWVFITDADENDVIFGNLSTIYGLRDIHNVSNDVNKIDEIITADPSINYIIYATGPELIAYYINILKPRLPVMYHSGEIGCYIVVSGGEIAHSAGDFKIEPDMYSLGLKIAAEYIKNLKVPYLDMEGLDVLNELRKTIGYIPIVAHKGYEDNILFLMGMQHVFSQNFNIPIKIISGLEELKEILQKESIYGSMWESFPWLFIDTYKEQIIEYTELLDLSLCFYFGSDMAGLAEVKLKTGSDFVYQYTYRPLNEVLATMCLWYDLGYEPKYDELSDWIFDANKYFDKKGNYPYEQTGWEFFNWLIEQHSGSDNSIYYMWSDYWAMQGGDNPKKYNPINNFKEYWEYYHTCLIEQIIIKL